MAAFGAKSNDLIKLTKLLLIDFIRKLTLWRCGLQFLMLAHFLHWFQVLRSFIVHDGD